jgi:DNA-binding response OmpR family regulator
MHTILVLDNDKGIRLLLSEELAREGYDVIARGDDSRPAELIDRYGPDLIVMDVRLGPSNGLDLLRDIRRRYERLPVIVYTSNRSLKKNANTVAADYIVTRSLDLGHLKSTIQAALKQVPQEQGPREGPAYETTTLPAYKQLGFGFDAKE